MQQLVEATVAAAVAAGATVHTGWQTHVTADGPGWRVDDDAFDRVVLAIPPPAAVDTVTSLDEPTRTLLGSAETADVVMITMHVGSDQWPERLAGLSGYLVPKPVQRDVTAVSFASQKWAHWQPPSGGQILRVSIGRDGMPALHHDDDTLVARALADLRRHLGIDVSPLEIRIDRWPGAFAQYRPHHRAWVDEVRTRLPQGLEVAGAGYDGLGIPACVRSGRRIAELVVESMRQVPQ